jgi:hypothetical protein
MRVITLLTALLVPLACLAQTTQAPATPDELDYFRYTLMNIASIDHDPAAAKTFEASLVKHLGLNPQEAGVIHGASQELAALLQQLRRSAVRIVGAGKQLTSADTAALSDLTNQREQLIATLANRILNSVRPEVAARLRHPGQFAAGKSGNPK